MCCPRLPTAKPLGPGHRHGGEPGPGAPAVSPGDGLRARSSGALWGAAGGKGAEAGHGVGAAGGRGALPRASRGPAPRAARPRLPPRVRASRPLRGRAVPGRAMEPLGGHDPAAVAAPGGGPPGGCGGQLRGRMAGIPARRALPSAAGPAAPRRFLGGSPGSGRGHPLLLSGRRAPRGGLPASSSGPDPCRAFLPRLGGVRAASSPQPGAGPHPASYLSPPYPALAAGPFPYRACWCVSACISAGNSLSLSLSPSRLS